MIFIHSPLEISTLKGRDEGGSVFLRSTQDASNTSTMLSVRPEFIEGRRMLSEVEAQPMDTPVFRPEYVIG
ncbi:hypothetical protein ACFL2Y_02155 [Candidatus Omnitrophota bacterium]